MFKLSLGTFLICMGGGGSGLSGSALDLHKSDLDTSSVPIIIRQNIFRTFIGIFKMNILTGNLIL